MSDSMYHALGSQQDPANPQSQPGAPQSRPPPASGPAGYQQNSSTYGQNQAPPHSSGQYGYTQQSQAGYNQQGTPSQEQGYFPQQGSMSPQSPGSMASLTSHMGSMGLGNESAAPARPGKKKHRHAHHNINQESGSSQAFNGIPQGQSSPSQFLDQSRSSHPYGGQPITPQMTQFPAPSGGTFMPTAPRPGTSGGGTAMDVTTGSGVSGQGRVDPEQIPSVPRSRDGPAQYYLDHTYLTMEQHLPPPSTVPFIAFDQGNSSPKYARLTLNNIPSSAEALAATALPLGLVLQPLAPLAPGEHPIPVLDFGETGPPRCRRCRAYINPFMIFRSGGNKFVCNMCTFPNDVPSEYFAPTDPSGIRVDRDQRPELKLGTVEFMVPKEYWAKEPVGLRHLFLIDVSQEAINRGFLEAFCDGILAALYGDAKTADDTIPEESRSIPVGSKVGFVTFDKEVHFYNCNVSYMLLAVRYRVLMIEGWSLCTTNACHARN